jgi:hypothetical protein
VVVVKPGRVRHYAKARAQPAKTDKIGARLMAAFGRDLQPEFHPLPNAETQALAVLCFLANPAGQQAMIISSQDEVCTALQ